MRMKRSVLTVLSLLMPLLLLAGAVTEKQAADIAAKFLAEKGRAASVRGRSQAAVATMLVPVGGSSLYHIFNVGQSDGYVIVSGDDRTTPVLGYSHSGAISSDSMPENLRAWLDSYAEQIEWLQQHDPDADAAAVRRSLPVYSTVQPLTRTEWDQGSPYNGECPYYSGGQCMTGCIATAMAQVMYYHQWPARTKSSIPSYTTDTYRLKVDSKPVTTIDWGSMNLSYHGGGSGSAVAKLMALAGASVKMDYSLSNSGSYSALVAPALVNYFNYDGTAKHIQRLFYNTAAWEKLIYDELAASRPVYYGGASTGGGHAFVIDGYDNGYFNVNWGWSGKSNGLFLLSVLDPNDYSGSGAGSGGSGFSIEQTAVIGIQPYQGTPYTEDPLTVRSITVSGNKSFTRFMTNSNFTNIKVVSAVYNEGASSHTYELGYGLFDKSGNMVYSYSEGTNTMDLLIGSYVTSTLSFGAGLSDGTYYLRAIHRVQGTSSWITNTGGNKFYLQATISGRTLTLSEPDTSLSGDLSVSGDLRKGRTVTITADITNNGPDFSGMLYIYADGTMIGGQTVDLSSGEIGSFETTYTLKEAGTMNLSITTDKEGTKEIGRTTINVASAPATNISINMTSPNVDANNLIRGSTLKMNLSLTNNLSDAYDDYIDVQVFKLISSSGMGMIVSEEKFDAYIRGSQTYEHSVTVTDLEQGERYMIFVYYVSEGEPKVGFRSSLMQVGEPPREEFAAAITAPAQDIYVDIPVVVTVGVRNNGESSTGRLYVFVDNDLLQEIDVEMQPGEEKLYTVSFTPTESRTYTMRVSTSPQLADGSVLASTDISVADKDRRFSISNLVLEEQELFPDIPINATFTVTREGYYPECTLYFFIDGSNVGKMDIYTTISADFLFRHTPQDLSAGKHTLTITADEAGMQPLASIEFTIKERVGQIVVSGMTITTDTVYTDMPAKISITMRNEGETAGEATFYLFYNFNCIATLSVHLDAGQEQMQEVEFVPTTTGWQRIWVSTDPDGFYGEVDSTVFYSEDLTMAGIETGPNSDAAIYSLFTLSGTPIATRLSVGQLKSLVSSQPAGIYMVRTEGITPAACSVRKIRR